MTRNEENLQKLLERMARENAERFRYVDANGGLRAEFTRDGIHFDAAGYRTVFDRLKEYL